ncbi:alpha/beta hydrolase [Planomonospora corallina]|uniref:Acyl-CoA:diacylglycerol acyltransferase n=1 Tax=Planomonospora corallina TaxID=1806052 RepID=A0ABV8I9D3_9ACTN
MRSARHGLLALAAAAAVTLPTAAYAAPLQASAPAGQATRYTLDPGTSPSGPWPAALPGGPQVVQENWLDPRTVDLTVSSPAVNAQLPVRLLLPKGWSKQANRTWPVLYLFHGGADNYTSWTRQTGIEEMTANVDAIVVMPEAGATGNYSDWYNGGKGGPPAWETFHTKELIGLLESGYKAGSRRAVSGISMGAHGAMKYAAKNPGMFRFVGAHSGILSTRLPGVPSAIMRAQEKGSQDPKALWGDPIRNRDVWKANDPTAYAKNLQGVTIYISGSRTGLKGEFDAPDAEWHPAHLGEPLSTYTARHLITKLRAYGVKPTVNFYKRGTHSWPYWEREFKTSFPTILKSLGLDQNGGSPGTPTPTPTPTPTVTPAPTGSPAPTKPPAPGNPVVPPELWKLR